MESYTLLMQEEKICNDYVCCGLHLPDLHALVEHFEDVHTASFDLALDPPLPLSSACDSEPKSPAYSTDSTKDSPKFRQQDYIQHQLESQQTYSHFGTRIDRTLFLSKPFRCPKPRCKKSYRQANGLKYHMMHGTCGIPMSKESTHLADSVELRGRKGVDGVDGCSEIERLERRLEELESFLSGLNPSTLAPDMTMRNLHGERQRTLNAPHELSEYDEGSHPNRALNVQMFSDAQNVSMRDTTITNAGRDVTINHNHNSFFYPTLPWNYLPAWPDLSSNVKSHVSHAGDKIKRALSGWFWPSEKVAKDAVKYPPISNATVLLSKTSMFKPGIINCLVSSVRYSFF